MAAPRIGRICTQQGIWLQTDPLWFPRRTSLMQVCLHRWFRRVIRQDGNDSRLDWCKLYYSSTRAIPGFITVDFLVSGPQTSMSTVRAALAVLEEVARERQALAILAHVGNSRISDRILLRWGWEPHAARLGKHHWIKRFYDGYPQSNVQRYLASAPQEGQ